MLLQHLFPVAHILPSLESEDKEELFEEMVESYIRADPHAAQPEKARLRTSILRALQEREAKMTTGIMPGIAIPHAMVPELSSMIGMFGISRNGIAYESLDGKPVYLVFMLLAPPAETDLHLEALRTVTEFLEMPDMVTAVMEARTASEVEEVFKRFDALR
ncbi:MAG: PTS sugar transporter subunit IIA [Spirochaetales bacterium]|nr:PTS sugar transporter subunit IIA [Spirochaetales bacterium]